MIITKVYGPREAPFKWSPTMCIVCRKEIHATYPILVEVEPYPGFPWHKRIHEACLSEMALAGEVVLNA